LDLCSSHVSHYPDNIENNSTKVVILGMNEDELWSNKQANEFIVQDLNENPTLPFPDNSFDIITNAVSIDYLIKPVEICNEVARVLKPKGKAYFSLSNRSFPTKTINMWNETSDVEHAFIVGSFFHFAGGF